MGFFTGLFALISGIVAALLSATISRMLKEKVAWSAGFAAFFGLIVWLIGAFSTKGPGVALLLLILGILAVAVLMVRWHFEGSKIFEMICFGLLSLVLMLSNLQAAAVISKWVETIPKIVFVLSLAFFVFDMLRFKLYLEKVESEDELDEHMKHYENPLGSIKKKIRDFDNLVKDVELEEMEDLGAEEPINFGLND